jgi:hypothetical protein
MLKPLLRRRGAQALLAALLARYLARDASYRMRQRPDEREVPHVAPNGDAARARMQTVMDRWFDWPLPFGFGRAGDLTRANCKQIIEKYAAHERGLRSNRKVFEELGAKLPESEVPARQVFTSAELGAFLRRVR